MWRFEVKLQRFFQVGERLFLGLTLTGNVDLETSGDVPIPFSPDGSSKRSLHNHILSQKRAFFNRLAQPMSPARTSPN